MRTSHWALSGEFRIKSQMRSAKEIRDKLTAGNLDGTVNFSQLARAAQECGLSINDQPKISRVADGTRKISYDEGCWLSARLWPDDPAGAGQSQQRLDAAWAQGVSDALAALRPLLALAVPDGPAHPEAAQSLRDAVLSALPPIAEGVRAGRADGAAPAPIARALARHLWRQSHGAGQK